MAFEITFNYCKCRKFRKLFNGLCQQCLGYNPDYEYKKEEKFDEIKKTKKSKREKPQIKKESNNLSIIKEEKLNEEKLLLEQLKDKKLMYREYWRKEIADILNWDTRKVQVVFRRLNRKGLINKKHSYDAIIELLSNNSDGMTPREIQEKLQFTSKLTLYNILCTLVKRNILKRDKRLYSVV